MQDLQIKENIVIEKVPILQRYNTKQIQTLFIQFIENLEKKDSEMKKIVELHKIDYKDLPTNIKKTFDKYKDYDLEDFEKAGFN